MYSASSLIVVSELCMIDVCFVILNTNVVLTCKPNFFVVL